jgi:GNAT superfamily N-acetyltransferase
VATCAEIIRLEKPGSGRAALALARAFFGYDLMVYAAPDPSRRERGVTALYDAILRDCFRLGEVHVTREGDGAACWLPPGVGMPSLWRQIRSGMLRMPLRFGWHAFQRLVPYDTVARTLHHEYAAMPNWYLAAIGVEPQRQGQGVGGALMQPILQRADDSKLPCYLETHRPDNVRLYERHGFEVMEQAAVPGHPIPVWAMLRRPR